MDIKVFNFYAEERENFFSGVLSSFPEKGGPASTPLSLHSVSMNPEFGPLSYLISNGQHLTVSLRKSKKFRALL